MDLTGGDGNDAFAGIVFVVRCFSEISVADILEVEGFENTGLVQVVSLCADEQRAVLLIGMRTKATSDSRKKQQCWTGQSGAHAPAIDRPGFTDTNSEGFAPELVWLLAPAL